MSLLPPDPNAVPPAGTPPVQSWSATECGFKIGYSTELIDRIRHKAVESFHLLPHGGLELGGLLFGRVYPNARTPLRIELIAERPIACSHQDGPGFSLTEEERAQILAQLERTRLDPELSAFSVLGFWVSHGRGELALSASDREVYKLFPHAWQVVLMLKPEAAQPARATFFFREGGRIGPHAAEHEFVCGPHPVALRASAPKAEPGNALSPIRARRAIPPALQRVFRAAKGLGGRHYQAAFFLTLAMFVGASLTYALLALKKHPPAPLPEPVNLEIFPNAAGALIHWNAQANDIQHARRGDLLVHDGAKLIETPLTGTALQKGFASFEARRVSNRTTPAAAPPLRATLVVVEQNGRVLTYNGRYWPMQPAHTGAGKTP